MYIDTGWIVLIVALFILFSGMLGTTIALAFNLSLTGGVLGALVGLVVGLFIEPAGWWVFMLAGGYYGVLGGAILALVISLLMCLTIWYDTLFNR